MVARPVTIAALLDVARDLNVKEQFDPAVVLRILEHLQCDDLDVQVHSAVTHARLCAQSVQNGSNTSRDALARFALERVVTLLEQYMAADAS